MFPLHSGEEQEMEPAVINQLSRTQLNNLSDAQLDELLGSLYDKYDCLKSTIDKNVWVGDYGSVSSNLGIQATSEIEEIRRYILCVTQVVNERKSSHLPKKRPKEPTEFLPEHWEWQCIAIPEASAKVFSSFVEATTYAKANPGLRLSRTNDGNSWAVEKK